MTRADNAHALGRSLDAPDLRARRADIINGTGDHTAGHITLDGNVQAVPAARTWLRQAAAEAQLPAGLADDLALAASELVTNSLRHSRSWRMPESIELWLDAWPDLIVLTVTDTGAAIHPNHVPGLDHDSLTHIVDPLPDVAVDGRGRGIVAELADEIGYEERPWPTLMRHSWALWRLHA